MYGEKIGGRGAREIFIPEKIFEVDMTVLNSQMRIFYLESEFIIKSPGSHFVRFKFLSIYIQ